MIAASLVRRGHLLLFWGCLETTSQAREIEFALSSTKLQPRSRSLGTNNNRNPVRRSANKVHTRQRPSSGKQRCRDLACIAWHGVRGSFSGAGKRDELLQLRRGVAG